MPTTIQINSLEALERLIGNDNEVEINIRNSIVQEFSKKHLKSLVTSTLLDSLAEKLKKEVIEEFRDKTQVGMYTLNVELSKEVMANLKKKLTDRVWEQLYNLINEILQKDKINETIQDALVVAVSRIIRDISDTNLENRLNDMVDKKIKEKLNLK